MALSSKLRERRKVFRWTPTDPNNPIAKVRSGRSLKGLKRKGSLGRAEEAAAQSGGPLPGAMFAKARKGKFVKDTK